MRVSGALWKRYRALAGIGVLLGAVVGVVFVFVIGGDTDMLPSQAVLGGSAGALTAIIACAGGYLALRWRALAAVEGRSPSGLSGAGGAGIAVLVMWLFFGAVAAVSSRTAFILMLALPVAIIAGVVTWTIAAFALEWHERRHEHEHEHGHGHGHEEADEAR